MSESYHWCESTVTGARAPITAVSYDSECATSTFVKSVHLLWAAVMDAQIAEAPRIILILPDPSVTDTETIDDSPGDGGSGDGSSSSGGGSGNDTSSTEGSSAGFSTEAKIAIGVVVPVVVFLAAALIWSLIRRKRASRASNSQTREERPGFGDGAGSGQAIKSELEGSPIASITGPEGVAFEKAEMDSGFRSRHAVSSIVGELDDISTGKIVSELDSTVAGRVSKPSPSPHVGPSWRVNLDYGFTCYRDD